MQKWVTDPVYPGEADGDDMGAPVRRGAAGAVAGRDAAPVEGHGYVVGAPGQLGDAGRQVETCNTRADERSTEGLTTL